MDITKKLFKIEIFTITTNNNPKKERERTLKFQNIDCLFPL